MGCPQFSDIHTLCTNVPLGGIFYDGTFHQHGCSRLSRCRGRDFPRLHAHSLAWLPTGQSSTLLLLRNIIMQIRSANSATHQPTKKCDPIIIAFDRNWNELYRERLSMIDGMAYGVREDYESGYRGIKTNWCTTNSTRTPIKVCHWATPN